MKTVIVTGGRDYADKNKVHQVLDLINPDLLVDGGASGADLLARGWALDCDRDNETIQAEWDKFGSAAGPMRNSEMLRKYPKAIVVAFPGGRGTADCIEKAQKLNRLVLKVLA